MGPSSSGYTGIGMTFVGDNFECFLSMMTFETGFKFCNGTQSGSDLCVIKPTNSSYFVGGILLDDVVSFCDIISDQICCHVHFLT